MSTEEYTKAASKRHKKKMLELVGEEHQELIKGTLHGQPTPYHWMYKLDDLPVPGIDAHYEFLIEYCIADPSEGIYYGVKLISSPKSDHKAAIAKANEHWQELQPIVKRVLNNVFIDKSFTDYTFRETDNDNDHTYWPFWISLYEEENIRGVALAALKLIRGVYSHYVNGGTFDKLALGNETVEKEVQTRFTQTNYDELLEGWRRILYLNDKDKKNHKETGARIFERFLKNAEEAGWIKRLPEYFAEIGYRYVGDLSNEPRKPYAYEFPALIKELYELIRNNNLSDKEKEVQQKNTIPCGIPWESISKIFVKPDYTLYRAVTMENSVSSCRAKNGPKWNRLLKELLPEDFSK